ncbi:hypothetical protein FQR65_LT12014 [Abscondita terminalis]|nr:hypothetical protein FQR65_LT12014 [Abscondita terminalis]
MELNFAYRSRLINHQHANKINNSIKVILKSLISIFVFVRDLHTFIFYLFLHVCCSEISTFKTFFQKSLPQFRKTLKTTPLSCTKLDFVDKCTFIFTYVIETVK